MRFHDKFSARLALPVGLIALMGVLAARPLAAQSASGTDAAQAAAQMARGAKLWVATCNRCHDLRSPAERTDRQWATIVAHMRTRANLTEADAEAILVFLQASNGPEGGSGRTAQARPATHGGGSASDLARQETLRYDALQRSHPERAKADRPLHDSLLRYLARLMEAEAPRSGEPRR